MDDALNVTFALLSVLFSVWTLMTLIRYIQYRKIAGKSILSWPPRRPWYYNLCVGIGFFMLFLTGLSAFVLDRPPLVIIAQGLMAVFYTMVFPLIFRIRRGFFETGISTERGFVVFSKILWLGWKEVPEIVLALRARGRFGGQRYSFLRVPGDYFGQARRILADSIKEHALTLETSVLGLNPEAPTQEQV